MNDTCDMGRRPPRRPVGARCPTAVQRIGHRRVVRNHVELTRPWAGPVGAMRLHPGSTMPAHRIGGGMERRYREADSSDLWWQIAVGGFIALLAHSIVVGLYSRYETSQAMAQLERESKLATQQMQRAFARNVQAPREAPTAEEYNPPRPLRDGERCLQGRRFTRVSNGWVQMPRDPC